MPARVASLFVAAERRGATGGNIPDCPPLFLTQHRGVPLEKLGAAGAEHVTDFGVGVVYGVSIGASASRGLTSNVTRSSETVV